jgi:glycosyltransferase involved in cell wall biosynthesis
VKIGIDLATAAPRLGGGWQYAASLVAALAGHDGDNEYHLFTNASSAALVPHDPRFRATQVAGSGASRLAKLAFESVLMGMVPRQAELDCMHHLFGAVPVMPRLPTVVTVHDLMVYARPGDFSPWRRQYVRATRRHAVQRATVVTPLSRSTADHIQQVMGLPAERMCVVPAAIGNEFQPVQASARDAFRRRYGLPDRFWLYVAGDMRHKNHLHLTESYRRYASLVNDPWPLVAGGAPVPSLERVYQGLVDQRQAIILPWIEPADMPTLYSAATALVFPSLFEGGGLPVMEAMACGCPVAAADIPTTREFAGAAALTFDPTSTRATASAMVQMHDATVRRQLSARGLAQLDQLRPAQVVRALLDAYGRAAGLRPPQVAEPVMAAV